MIKTSSAFLATLALAGLVIDPSIAREAEPLPARANVARANCHQGDKPEKGLQGQVTLAERMSGYLGANCNLILVSNLEPKIEPGGFRLFTMAHDRAGRLCGYSSAKSGTSVVDLGNPGRLVETTLLTTPAMRFALEGLKANETRGLLASARYIRSDSATTDPDDKYFDVYDIGSDCRQPKLLASVQLPFATNMLPPAWHGVHWPNPDYAQGHEGNFSPDGRTYYIADVSHGVYHAVNLDNPAKPLLLDTFMAPGYKGHTNAPDDANWSAQGMPHSLSVSIDGKRAFMSLESVDTRFEIIPRSGEWRNGFMVVDTSEIQARKPGGKMRYVAEATSRDGGGSHGPIDVRIRGRSYIITNDEFGIGQLTAKGRLAACALGLPPNGMIHIWDMRRRDRPNRIARLIMEVNDPRNCSAVEPETAAASTDLPGLFMYDPHQCSVDNRENATALACSYFQGGIRVFDIRNPRQIREIAYYIPPAKPRQLPQICGSMPRFDFKTRMIYSYCGDTGYLALQFRKGTWPFPDSRTPSDRAL
jgi:hypothetical protein